MEEKFFEDLKEKILPYFKEDGSHGFDHTQRVYNLSLKISEEEDVDLDVVKMAALLHDIARMKEEVSENICHAEEGAKMAKEILTGLGVAEDKINKVAEAIEVHRYSKGLKAETKEAEILQDADRLDALGAICIARVFGYSGKIGRIFYDSKLEIEEYTHNHESNSAINHFHEKILKIKPETFKTKKAKEIAKGRYNFIQEFLDRFIQEWEGKL